VGCWRKNKESVPVQRKNAPKRGKKPRKKKTKIHILNLIGKRTHKIKISESFTSLWREKVQEKIPSSGNRQTGRKELNERTSVKSGREKKREKDENARGRPERGREADQGTRLWTTEKTRDVTL